MIKAPRGAFFPPSPVLRSTTKWVSSSPLIVHQPRAKDGHRRPSVEFSLVSALKSSSSSLSSGEQLHAFAVKSGLLRSNLFVRNGLLNLYARCCRPSASRRLFLSAPFVDTASWNIMISMHVKLHQLDDARHLFDETPHRDCVSFTTMIMGLARHGLPSEALAVFRDMLAMDVTPNEVTLGTIISACSHLHAPQNAKMIHAMAVKRGLDGFVLVSTNLVHVYAICSDLEDSEAVFHGMPERNIVTWNAMLNGYTKAGLIDSAVDLFKRIPTRDLVSWGTLIDGYLQVDRLEGALFSYRGMLRDADARPNEVMLVNLVSACERFSAIIEDRLCLSAIPIRKPGTHLVLECDDWRFPAELHAGCCEALVR